MKNCPDPLTIKEWPPQGPKKRPSLFSLNGSACDRPNLWEKTKWRSLVGSAVRWCRPAAPLLRTARLVYRSGHFLRSENVLFFLGGFFHPISLHTKPVLFSTFSRRRGVLPSIPCIFLLGGPISSPTDATVVLHWAYKRSTEEFDPEITVLLIVAQKKNPPEDHLLSKKKARKSPYGAQDCTNCVACPEFHFGNLAWKRTKSTFSEKRVQLEMIV